MSCRITSTYHITNLSNIESLQILYITRITGIFGQTPETKAKSSETTQSYRIRVPRLLAHITVSKQTALLTATRLHPDSTRLWRHILPLFPARDEKALAKGVFCMALANVKAMESFSTGRPDCLPRRKGSTTRLDSGIVFSPCS